MTRDESVKLEGAPNFRDFGGHPTTDGRSVRSGRLFRSDALAELTESDLVRIGDLPIGVICDLRSAEERRRYPNRWPDSRSVEIIAFDDGGELTAVKATRWRERLLNPHFDAEQARQGMRQAYAGMPLLFSRHLATVFARLECMQNPSLLVHCTAGKDRTGFFSAMMLSALGVSWTAILADYLESSIRRSPAQLGQWVVRRHLEPGERCDSEALSVIAGVSIDFLETAVGAIDRQFGSVEAYLETACGLDAGRRTRLRDQLLTA